MLSILGMGVGKAVAIGEAYVIDNSDIDIPDYPIAPADIDAEIERLETALAESRDQLTQIRDNLPADAPTESASFIDTHLLMLRDTLLVDESKAIIRREKLNAEAALWRQVEVLIEVFLEIKDPYLRDRKTDIEQVANRIVRNLMNLEHHTLDRHNQEDLKGKIIVARDLSPAETVFLKGRGVAAFITDLGGPISHTAILARTLHIPASVGLHGATHYIRDGDLLVVDGLQGVVIVGADEKILKSYRKLQREIRAKERSLKRLVHNRARTQDGPRVRLMANIELPEDIRAAKKVNSDGVGLYRTEYLYMNRPDLPSENEQFYAYRRIIRILGKRVTFRTLDIGDDKHLERSHATGTPSQSPLGLRAVRLCLQNPEVFRPQLRAILRASAYGPAAILIPMLTSIRELRQVKSLIAEIKTELRSENKAFDRRIPIGGMVEVPAAAVSAEMFARELDFLSIGTNDLIQFTLAIDRVDDKVNYLYDPLHPAVLQLIKAVIVAGKRSSVPIAMCGEMAGNSEYTKLLLGLGLRTFSMEPSSILEVKETVLATDLPKIQHRVHRIIRTADAGETRELVAQLNQL